MGEVFDMCLNTEHYVVMSNDLIKGKQSMGINELKLLRLTIMQVVLDDDDFKTYRVGIQDLAKLIGIDSSNIYREVRNMCKNLLRCVVEIGDGNSKHKWTAFQWVSRCKYDGNGTLEIQLHDDLKPYLLKMNKWYTQYILGSTIQMSSVYAIRIFELLFMELKNRKIGNGITLSLSVETIRKACDCENKLLKMSDFRRKVIDMATKEINEKTDFHVLAEPYKRGRSIAGFNFILNYRWNVADDNIKGQIYIDDYKEVLPVKDKKKGTKVV